MDYRKGLFVPSGRSTPTNRVVYTMWKLRGAEPMKHGEIESRVPYDGTSATFDLEGNQKSTNGNLKITLLRSPQKIRRGVDKYDWNVRVEWLVEVFCLKRPVSLLGS